MKKITLFGLLLVLGACSSPECNNTYPVFDNYKPDTENYKTELASSLLITAAALGINLRVIAK